MVTPFLPVLHYLFFVVVLWCALIDNCIGKQVFQRNRNAYKLRISPFVIIKNLSINIKIRMLWERKRETPATHRRRHPMETARRLPVSIRPPLAGFESRRLYAVRPDISYGGTVFYVWPNYLYIFRTFQGKLNSQVLNKKKSTLSNMSTISIADILELPVQERIRLVELIWDSVAALPEAVEISPALKAELEARLAEFEANPEAGYSWDQVKSHLKKGSWHTV